MMILVGYLYISKNPSIIDGIPKPDNQPVTTPVVSPTDTTTKITACTYDRIILTSQAKTDFTGNSGVFRFDQAYNLTYHMTIAVSDHYPVFAESWNNRDTD
jgi:hypothetical protein